MIRVADVSGVDIVVGNHVRLVCQTFDLVMMHRRKHNKNIYPIVLRGHTWRHGKLTRISKVRLLFLLLTRWLYFSWDVCLVRPALRKPSSELNDRLRWRTPNKVVTADSMPSINDTERIF